jgi:tetratricopeptide (TPR) repeat protein
MRTPLDMDTVARLGLDAGTPEQQRQAVEQLILWAAERHPADAVEVTPAALSAEARKILELLGDHAAALEVYRRAATAEGAVEPDVRCFLHRALVSVGELPAARLLAEEVRRSAPADPGAYAMIGETYEKAGDLREAHRWLNLGLQRFSGRAPDDDSTDQHLDLVLLAIVRRRIRRALGLPPDAVDRLAGPALPGRGETTGEA